jgi:hypothetical protein
VADGSITITGLTYGGINAEGFCTDGEFLYCCTGNNIIFKINPATWAATVQCTILGGGVDCIAYDEDNDAFWIATYNTTSARRVSRTGGAAQKTLTATLPIADLAWEKSSDGTPYLWMSACASPANLNLHRWNLNTDAFTANAKITTDIPNQSGGTGGAGLFTCVDMSTEKSVLIGLIEGDNDVAYCYELGEGGTPPPPCDPATNFNVTYAGDCSKAELSWTAPQGGASAYNIYRNGILIKSNHEGTSYNDETFIPTEGHKWEVKVVCEANESDPVEKTLPACTTPCDKVTGETAKAECEEAVISWTAVVGAKEYKVSRDGALLGTVNTNTYTETGNFNHGVEYTWTIVTVCEKIESDPVTVKTTANCEGIHELGLAAFKIAPNPAVNEITISANVYFNTVEVINFLGQAVISQTVNHNAVKLDVSNLNNGIYFVRLASENGTSVKKFVKQ